MPESHGPRWQVHHGDAREVLSWLGGVHIDAIVTDPPYGIGFDFARDRKNRDSGLAWAPGHVDAVNRGWENVAGDDEPFDPAPWLGFPVVVLWGAQNYADRLPASRGWLVWDKRNGSASDSHGDAELAWTNLDRVVRLYSQLWRGLVREGEENVANGPKLHPCQKPVALMGWTLEEVGIQPGMTVYDPYMGSGSTLVACHRRGVHSIGADIKAANVEIARSRLEAESRQGRLFA